ncbi:MAG: hypothetical protein KDB74_13235 [Flavobacteriales bacterium]|nr:hypothetical protein [Flavobacteriales bacterium]
MNTSGTVIDKEEFYPFGDSSLRTFTKKRYRYVGKEKDQESGLYYYGARYYAAWTCRFISVDPLAGKYKQLTPYNNAGNNPVNDYDIDGMQSATTKTDGVDSTNSSTGGSEEPKTELNVTIHFVKGEGITDVEYTQYLSTYTENLESVFNDTNQSYTDGQGNTSEIKLNASYKVDNISTEDVPTNSPEGVYYVIVRKGGGASNVDSETNIASMNTSDGDNTPAHEFLHQLGLADRYNYIQNANESGNVKTGNGNWSPVPMALNQSYDPDYYGNELANIMVDSSQTTITNKQWDIIFSGGKEDLNQTTFFSNLITNRSSGNNRAPLGLDRNGTIFTSRQGVNVKDYKIHGYFNANSKTGNSWGNKAWNFSSTSRYGNNNQQNQAAMSAPYTR